MKKNSATDNIRRVTEEIQQVYDDLSSLAQGVHHTKALYGGIMTINDRYGQLIGTLVHELKMASDAKLKHQQGVIDRQGEFVVLLRSDMEIKEKEVKGLAEQVSKLEVQLHKSKDKNAAYAGELESLRRHVETIEESKRIEFFKHFEERQALQEEMRRSNNSIERMKDEVYEEKKMLERAIEDLFGQPTQVEEQTKTKATAVPKKKEKEKENGGGGSASGSGSGGGTGDSVEQGSAHDEGQNMSPVSRHNSSNSNSKNINNGHKSPTKTSSSGGLSGLRAHKGNDMLLAALNRAKEAQRLAEAERNRVQAQATQHFVREKPTVGRRPMRPASTQTEMHDVHSTSDNSEPFFDISGGWVLPVSGSLVARQRWREAFAFAKCKYCRGVPRQISKTALSLRQAQYGEVDYLKKVSRVKAFITTTSVSRNQIVSTYDDSEYDCSAFDRGSVQGLKKPVWQIGSQWRDFMVHLPKSISLKAPFFPPQVVVSRLLNLWNMRLSVWTAFRRREFDAQLGLKDQEKVHGQSQHKAGGLHCDEADKGRHFKRRYVTSWTEYGDCANIMEFVVDSYLLCSSSRLDAEKQLYMLLTSIRDAYKSNPCLNMFARLLHLVKGPDKNQLSVDGPSMMELEKEFYVQDFFDLIRQSIPLETGLTREHGAAGAVAQKNKLGHKEVVADLEPVKEIHNSALASKGDKLAHNDYKPKFTTSETQLPHEAFDVYSYLRRCLCAPYTGVYRAAIEQAKQEHKEYKRNEESVRDGSVSLGNGQCYRELAAMCQPGGAGLGLGSPGRGHGQSHSAPHTARSGTTAVPHTNLKWKPVEVPGHILVDRHGAWWVPLDRAIRVIQGVFGGYMNEDGLQNIYRDIEANYVSMLSLVNYSLSSPECERVFIRTTMRKFTRTRSLNGEDLDWDDKEMAEREKVKALARNSQTGTKATGNAMLKDAIDNISKSSRPLVCDLDLLLAVIIEKIMIRYHYVQLKSEIFFENYLKSKRYTLSFAEFNMIFQKMILKNPQYQSSDNCHGVECNNVQSAHTNGLFSQAAESSLEQRQVMNIYKHLLLMNNTRSLVSLRVDINTVHHVSVESLMQLCRQLKLFPLWDEKLICDFTLKALGDPITLVRPVTVDSKAPTREVGTETCNLQSQTLIDAVGVSAVKPGLRAADDDLFSQITSAGHDNVLRSSSSQSLTARDSQFANSLGSLTMPAKNAIKMSGSVPSLEPAGRSNTSLDPISTSKPMAKSMGIAPAKAPSTKHMVPNPNASHSKNLLMKIQNELSAKRQERANL